MSGICGYYNDGREGLLDDMCEALAHCGPDDRGTFTSGPVGLGMTRLEINGEYTGRRPVSDEKAGVTVVFDGEIYNFRELRRELEKKGHRFRTKADAEVIAHLYEDLGYGCVEKLRGIFALAVWDGDTLFVARDRLGVKPLYYTWVKDRFYFASEIKGLLVAPGVDRAVDSEALDDYLTFRYVAAPKTLFKGVYKLPAGHWLKICRNGVRVNRYWGLAQPVSDVRLFGNRAREGVAALLQEAVRTRTLAAVPLGALLSGGLDSSLIVALLAQSCAEPVKTFHITFAGEEGEASFARQVAAELGCDHHELEATPEDLSAIPKVIWHLEEPVADAAAWATYLISRYAKQYVTVLLNGEGGDEVFAGYPRYLLSRLADVYHHSPKFFRKVFTDVVGKVSERRDASRFWRYTAKLANSAPTPGERNVAWLSVFAEAERRALYTDDFGAAGNVGRAAKLYEEFFKNSPGRSPVERLTTADITTSLVDDALLKVDKVSTAAGVEARVPFLDHVLVEYVARLSDRDRFGWGVPKKLLKEVAGDILPPPIVQRPKRAFEVPVARWLREYRRDWLRDTLFSPKALSRGYFRPRAVAALWDEFVDGGVGGERVWSLFCLEIWHQQFVDDFPASNFKVEPPLCVISS